VIPLTDAASSSHAAAFEGDVPVLLIDVTSLSRGAVVRGKGQGQGQDAVDEQQELLVARLLRLLADARDFDSHCEAFLYQHAFCRLSSPSNLPRDTKLFSQSLPSSHVIRPLCFPPFINGVSSALMHSRICSRSPHSCVTLIKQLLKQCLRPLHWKYACCLELEHMAAVCAAAPPTPPVPQHSLPDFQLISPCFICYSHS
jgi:hypothetical protein